VEIKRAGDTVAASRGETVGGAEREAVAEGSRLAVPPSLDRVGEAEGLLESEALGDPVGDWDRLGEWEVERVTGEDDVGELVMEELWEWEGEGVELGLTPRGVPVGAFGEGDKEEETEGQVEIEWESVVRAVALEEAVGLEVREGAAGVTVAPDEGVGGRFVGEEL